MYAYVLQPICHDDRGPGADLKQDFTPGCIQSINKVNILSWGLC